MKAYVSHQSALAFWRSDYAAYGSVQPCRVRSLDNAAVSQHDLTGFDFGGDRFGPPPLNVLTNDINRVNSDDEHVVHLSSGHIPVGSFVSLADDIYVASPELAFLQCASRCSLLESVLLGYELCGRYSLRPGTDVGFVQHEPWTNVNRILDFAKRLRAPHEPTKAMRTMQYVRDGSASPAESALAMRLVLPLRMGGSSLGSIELNAEIPVTGPATLLTASTSLFCDVYQPNHKVDIEYESYMHHTGREKLAADSERRSALGSLGITVVTVTANQLYSLSRFSALANHLRKLCGKRPFELTTDRLVAQDELCGIVLSGYRRRYTR